jgi:hypothetical protein
MPPGYREEDALPERSLDEQLEAENKRNGLFWMVYVSGSSGTTVRHHLKSKAIEEAKRLATSNRKKVALLQSIAIVEAEIPEPIITYREI